MFLDGEDQLLSLLYTLQDVKKCLIRSMQRQEVSSDSLSVRSEVSGYDALLLLAGGLPLVPGEGSPGSWRLQGFFGEHGTHVALLFVFWPMVQRLRLDECQVMLLRHHWIHK